MIRRLLAVAVLSVLLGFGAMALRGQSAPASQPASMAMVEAASSSPAGGPIAAEGARLRDQALAKLIAGDLEPGLAGLLKASQINPDDTRTAQLLSWVETYMAARTRVDAEREAEFDGDVRRVRYAMLAQSQQEALAASGLGAKIREHSAELAGAFSGSSNSEALDEADAESAGKFKEQSAKAMDKAVAALDKLADTIKDEKGDYAKTLRDVTDALRLRLKAYGQAWRDLKLDDASARHDSAAKLRALEDGIADSMSDIESLVSEEPWRVALVQARLARQTTDQPSRLPDADWYKALVSDVKSRADKAIAEARWYDALAGYAALSELEPDNEPFKEQTKIVRSHVRVLRLYGGKDDSTAGRLAVKMGTRPASAPASKPEEEPSWHEMTAGIDAAMVRDAIAKVADYYVVPVEYKKVARGGLTAVRVLADTPQAANSFPALADEAKHKAFVAVIDKQLEYVNGQATPDATTLALVFNSLLRASQDTVQIPTAVLAMEFTDGFLEELDRFSSMIWPNDVADFQKQTIGRFYGVGIQITKDPGEPLKVVTPLPDSPALKAGIKAGDLVLEVNGKPTDALSIDKLVDMIMGEKGTKVSLKIKRRGVLEPFDVALVREEINIRTVKGWRLLDEAGQWDYYLDRENKIGYIRISQFTDKTTQEVAEVLQELRRTGLRSLVMDLRFNPGGLLRAATIVADEFLRSGRIVYTQGRQTEKTEVKADGPGDFLTGDLVILVNESSASAAEIVSGALKDLHRATIIGDRSYGKGSVQNVIQIAKHNAFLKLTTAYYYVGDSGRLVHRSNGAKDWGVEPDIKVSLTPRQLERWLRIRRKTDLLPADGQQLSPADMSAQLEADMQLNTALMVLRLKQATPPAMAAK
jgi:carboxyl-terminal processing protease